MQNRKKSSQKLPIFYTAFFLLTACSSGADFGGKPAASSTQSITSSIAAPGSDAVAALPTAAPTAAPTTATTAAPTVAPTAAAETKVGPKGPPTAAELFLHNGPLEDSKKILQGFDALPVPLYLGKFLDFCALFLQRNLA